MLAGLGPGGAQRHDRIAEMSSEDQSKPQSVGTEEASHERELEPAAENAVEERKAAEYVGRQEDMKTKSSAPPASSPPLSNHLALEERLKAKAAEVSKLKVLLQCFWLAATAVLVRHFRVLPPFSGWKITLPFGSDRLRLPSI